MNGNPVFKGNNAQVAIAKLWDLRPESVAIMLLGLGTNGVLDDVDTPLFPQIGTLPQHFVLKILREQVFHNGIEDTANICRCKPGCVCKLGS